MKKLMSETSGFHSRPQCTECVMAYGMIGEELFFFQLSEGLCSCFPLHDEEFSPLLFHHTDFSVTHSSDVAGEFALLNYWVKAKSSGLVLLHMQESQA